MGLVQALAGTRAAAPPIAAVDYGGLVARTLAAGNNADRQARGTGAHSTAVAAADIRPETERCNHALAAPRNSRTWARNHCHRPAGGSRSLAGRSHAEARHVAVAVWAEAGTSRPPRYAARPSAAHRRNPPAHWAGDRVRRSRQERHLLAATPGRHAPGQAVADSAAASRQERPPEPATARPGAAGGQAHARAGHAACAD